MCGRFTLRSRAEALAREFACAIADEFPPRYNIAPTQLVAAVRGDASDGPRAWTRLRWGLIPSWAPDPSIGHRMINARAETVAEKPAFRQAFRRRRCLIPADGYFEWLARGREKQPYFIHFCDDRPFALAGLWERWQAAGSDEAIESCTVLTTTANELTRPIHDRMPVILPASAYAAWLDPALQDAATLLPWLRPCEVAGLIAEPVSRHVNSPRNDDAECVRCVEVRFEV